jgi:FkbM family methyltransferase
MFAISSIIPEISPIKIVDVGAMSIGDGEEPYARLLKAAPCEVIGFEPIEAEIEKLNAAAMPGRQFLPFFIGDGSEQTFYECNAPMTSSLLEPDVEFCGRFQHLAELMQVVKTSRVSTTRLDDIPEVRGTDLLKVDVQGGELMVFEGATDVLGDVAVINTEVEFVPMYKNQPLFGDIDAFLRARGFLLHRFLGFSGRSFKPFFMRNNPVGTMGQAMWSDAVYVRDFSRFEALPPEMLLKIATIMHENYRSVDLAGAALGAYDAQQGTALLDTYVGSFQKPAAAQ